MLQLDVVTLKLLKRHNADIQIFQSCIGLKIAALQKILHQYQVQHYFDNIYNNVIIVYLYR